MTLLNRVKRDESGAFLDDTESKREDKVVVPAQLRELSFKSRFRSQVDQSKTKAVGQREILEPTELRLQRHAQYPVVKIKVTTWLLEEYSDVSQVERKQLLDKIAELCNTALDDLHISITRTEHKRMAEQLASDILGLGPLEVILQDLEVSEVMVNGPNNIYVEKRGKIFEHPAKFDSVEHLMQIIDRIVSSLGRRIDESSPMVDARLKDGSRVNVIIPPLVLQGPVLTIRRFSKDLYTADNLINLGTLTKGMAQFLEACVKTKFNILISGGTGSGKTTTLNVLSSWIPEEQRIITIEDSAELQLRQKHILTLEARPANIEGRGQVTIRDLMVNSLRMRPDRIIIGECRGGEAFDMLQAMNTGHDGSLTTVHANSQKDALSRLENMTLMAGSELPSKAIREQMASAINIIVQQTRMQDGTRKIVAISEVLGFEGDKVRLGDIFYYKQRGVDEEGSLIGEFHAMGEPSCLEKIRSAGYSLDENIFVEKLEGIS